MLIVIRDVSRHTFFNALNVNGHKTSCAKLSFKREFVCVSVPQRLHAARRSTGRSPLKKFEPRCVIGAGIGNHDIAFPKIYLREKAIAWNSANTSEGCCSNSGRG
jgi:hypothetical protein